MDHRAGRDGRVEGQGLAAAAERGAAAARREHGDALAARAVDGREREAAERRGAARRRRERQHRGDGLVVARRDGRAGVEGLHRRRALERRALVYEDAVAPRRRALRVVGPAALGDLEGRREGRRRRGPADEDALRRHLDAELVVRGPERRRGSLRRGRRGRGPERVRGPAQDAVVQIADEHGVVDLGADVELRRVGAAELGPAPAEDLGDVRVAAERLALVRGEVGVEEGQGRRALAVEGKGADHAPLVVVDVAEARVLARAALA